MKLIIKNKVIDAPIHTILTTLRSELGGIKLHDIERERNDNIAVTCPIHKGGHESRPSCGVYTKMDNPNVEYGKVHCFTCGYTASLAKLVGDCFGGNEEFGEKWLLERFGTRYSESSDMLPEITLGKSNEKRYLDESVLKKYNFYHPYLPSRGISKEVIDKFQIGYDDKYKMVTFPVWDEKDKLVLITYRSVENKRFYIEEGIDKPIYLLNHIIKQNIQTVYIVESQINALTLWSWGFPAVASIGTGSYTQYKILNKCGVRNYILCFDGDDGGDKGIQRFIKNIRKDVFITVKNIPRGKDVNDLTKEEFVNLSEKVM